MPALSTQLKAVVVYPDRARLTRQGSITLEPGLHHLQVADLPTRLDQSSVRAAAQGTARARLLGVQVQRQYFAETPLEQVHELERQLETVQDQMRRLDDQIELARGSRASLAAMVSQAQIFATALAAGEMTAEKQAALFGSLRGQMNELDAELLRLQQEKRELERQAQKLKNELDRYRGMPTREQLVADLEVEVLEAGDLTLDLSYVTQGAGWQPLYDLRLREPEVGPAVLEVGYLAQVTQHTGQAWENVRLTLSTARPALAGRLPELDPWYVGPLPPPPMPLAMAAMPASAPGGAQTPTRGMVKAGRMEEARMPAPVEMAEAVVETSGTSVTYVVAGTVNIPGDGAPHKVSVATFPLQPRLDYVTAPRLTEAVYRRAKVSNASPYTLLPGAANLFAGDDFIGSMRMELVAPQAEIELFLGPDDRISVERELKRREVDKKFIGSRRREQFGYEIKLHNLLPKEARITLQDQIPVPRHEEVKTRLEAAEPRPTQQDELNRLTWEFSLAPQEKRTVRFDFSVEYPQAMTIVGL